MYYQFFGLAEPPFNLTPDSKFLFLSRRHEDALAALLYGVNERKGFIVLSGEIGSGKTTLYRTLIAQLDKEKVKIAVILNSFLTDLELLKTINEQFGLPAASDSKKELLDELNHFLVLQFTVNNNCVLIIDESQNLRPETLEQVRMISNLETDKEKLIQIVMVGQPQLARTLLLPELEQLNQRVTVRHHVTPLSEEEVGEYVRHRLRVARAQVSIEFTPQALRLLYHYSRGVPRRINVICDRALLAAYVQSRYDIDGDIIQQAVNEIRGEIRDDDSPESGAIGSVRPRAAAGSFDWRPLAGQAGFGLFLLLIVAGGVFLGLHLRESGQQAKWDALLVKPTPTPSPSPSPTPAASPTPAVPKPGEGSKAAAAASAGTVAPELTGTASPEITLTPTPRPTPSPVHYDAWTTDRQGVVRIERPDHAAAASYAMLLHMWGLSLDLDTFGKAPVQEVARFDLPAMLRQQQFHTYSTGDLTQAIKLDLPMMARLKEDNEKFAPHVAILRVQGDVFTIGDPLHGIQVVERKKFEPLVLELTVPFQDPKGIAGLRIGADGPAVEMLQRICIEEGQEVKQIDGKFGGKLRDQLREIQHKYNVPATGEVDPLTAAVIILRRRPDRPRLFS